MPETSCGSTSGNHNLDSDTASATPETQTKLSILDETETADRTQLYFIL